MFEEENRRIAITNAKNNSNNFCNDVKTNGKSQRVKAYTNNVKNGLQKLESV